MPPQRQESRPSGIIPGVVLIGGFILAFHSNYDRVPESLLWVVKMSVYWSAYVATQALLQSQIGAGIISIAKLCLKGIILVPLIPLVLIYNFGWFLVDGMRRARVMAQLQSGIETSMRPEKLTPNPDFVPAVDAEVAPAIFRSSYQYQALEDADSIRLLEVFPAAAKDKLGALRGRIVHARLSDSPRFTALSYCWNSLGFTNPVDEHRDPVLDLGSQGTLVLTQNLFNGLVSALGKGHFETNLLWVDQICIDQDNLIEKSSQVALMKEIYRQADLVLVWLGNDAPTGEGDRALRFADQIASRIEEKRLLSREFDLLPQLATSIDIGIPPLHEATSGYVALIALLTRPWFGRSWIVQEISLNVNKRVLCGSTEISFDSLATALSYCTRSLSFLMKWIPQETRTAFDAMEQSAKFTTRDSSAPSFRLLDVLVRHRGCKATLAADKVFAFLNISDDCENLGIKADYTMTKQAVFIKAAVAMLEHYEHLDLLGSTNAWPTFKANGQIASELLDVPDVPQAYLDENRLNWEDTEADGLPSWVPDWSVPTFAPSFQTKGEFGQYFSDYEASGRSAKSFQLRMDSTQLGLNGHILDRIIHVGPKFVDDIAYHYPVLIRWVGMCGAEDKDKIYGPTGEDMLSAFVNTLTCGGKEVTRKSHKPDTPTSTDATAQEEGPEKEDWLGGDNPFKHQFSMLLRVLYFLSLSETIMPGFSEKPFLFNFFLAVNQITLGITLKFRKLFGQKIDLASVSSGFRLRLFAAADHRRFIYTEKGFIGLASPQTKPGDYVALFSGGRVPIVIREAQRSESDLELWKIVGDAYVHGIMFGEGFLPADQRDTLWIC